MKLNHGIAAIITAAVLVASTSATANPYPQGTVVEGTLQFGRVHVPLPNGQWTVSGSAEWRDGSYEEFYFELIQTEGDRVTGYIQGGTNPNPSHGTWFTDNNCARRDMHYVNKKANYPREQDCAWVNHFEMTFDMDWPADKQTLEWLKIRGLKVPSAMISTGYRLADHSRYLDINYAHNPLESGFPPAGAAAWDTSDWHPSRVLGQPDRSAYIEKLKGWVEENWPRVRDSFKGNSVGPLASMLGGAIQQPAQTSPTPTSGQADSGPQPVVVPDATGQNPVNVAERLKALEGLRSQKLISEQEYKAKRMEILGEL